MEKSSESTHGKCTNGLENRSLRELANAWRSEIFPAILLVVGPPPRSCSGDYIKYYSYIMWKNNVISTYQDMYLERRRQIQGAYVPAYVLTYGLHERKFFKAFETWLSWEAWKAKHGELR